MVCRLKLIFDDDQITIGIFTKDVGAKVACGFFSLDYRKLHT